MENNWLDLDIEQTISEYEFTRGAVLNLNRIISSHDFESMDAHMIFEYLSKEMRIVRFNDFLKRYIYEKAGLEGSLESINEEVFRDIIITSFRDNHVPFSTTASASGYSNTVRKWLKRETVKRETIFLLGFGLAMSDADVTEFLTKVIQEDDLFVVTPTSNCTVSIEFSNRTPSSVRFLQDGKPADSYSKYVNDSITLPGYYGSVPDGFYFLGWLTSDLEETTSMPSALYTPGSRYTVTGDVTFRALYARMDGFNSSTGGEFKRYTGTLTSGDYILTYHGGAMQNTVSSSRLTYNDVFLLTDDIIFAPDKEIVWSISINGSSCTIYNSAVKKYAAGTSVNNKATLLESVTDYAKWSYSGTSTYEFINGGNGRYLHRNTNYGFACYDSSTGGALTLYKRTGRTVYYTTYTNACAHTNTVMVAATAPTCTENGYTAGIYCNGCQSYLSGHAVVSAKGHSYESVVTPPTATENGYTTYTCTACGDSYKDDYVDALGEVYIVNFWLPEGVAAVATMECGKNGITLPEADAPAGYSFAGWAAQSVDETQTKPTLYKAGDHQTFTSNTDLYAVFSYSTGNGGNKYVKVTEEPADWSGKYLIVYEAGSLIFNSSLEKLDAVSNGKTVTITSNTISADTNTAYQFIVAKTANGYSIQAANGNYIGQNADANGLTTSNTVLINSIRLDKNGNANIIANGGAYLRYNAASNQNRFRYYKSSTYTGQKPIALYVLTQSSETYYTSLGAAKKVVAAVYSGSEKLGEYAGFDQAAAACGQGQYVKLFANGQAGLTLEKDLYIDLNGFNLTGQISIGGYAVYGMDSTTDGYNGGNAGYFSCTSADGAAVIPQTHFKSDITGSVKRYMAIKTDAGYTFHRFYIGVTHASVKPSAQGVGYKAVFAGDDAVMAQIATFGFKVQLDGFDAVTAVRDADALVSGKAVTLRIPNFDVENHSETALKTSTVLTLRDGTAIESSDVTMTLRQMVEAVNANYAAYSAAQLAALKEMLDKHDVTADWCKENIH